MGLPTFNLDVIYGAAGETLADWRTTVEAILELDPPHVSAYALTVEAGTPLAGQPDRHPDDDDQADKYELADELLDRRRARELRGVELGPAGARVPAQPAVLAAARLPRLRVRGPLAPRRPAMVERAHARALHRRGARPGGRPRRRARRSTTTPAHRRAAAGAADARRRARTTRSTATSSPAWSSAPATAGSLTRRGRLLANEVSVRLR